MPWRFTEDLATAARTLVEDLGAPFVLLAVAGMLVAARRRAAWPVLAATLVDLVYAVTVNPMGTPDRQTLFVTEAGMAVLCALALGALVERLGPRWSTGSTALAAAPGRGRPGRGSDRGRAAAVAAGARGGEGALGGRRAEGAVAAALAWRDAGAGARGDDDGGGRDGRSRGAEVAAAEDRGRRRRGAAHRGDGALRRRGERGDRGRGPRRSSLARGARGVARARRFVEQPGPRGGPRWKPLLRGR
ncbi:MAG: hypothetical protein IPF99_12750 [Deltaproteobacteria bacterium]|nr:hypothetical protein [Deltaproteobacteria bacterium]